MKTSNGILKVSSIGTTFDASLRGSDLFRTDLDRNKNHLACPVAPGSAPILGTVIIAGFGRPVRQL